MKVSLTPAILLVSQEAEDQKNELKGNLFLDNSAQQPCFFIYIEFPPFPHLNLVWSTVARLRRCCPLPAPAQDPETGLGAQVERRTQRKGTGGWRGWKEGCTGNWCFFASLGCWRKCGSGAGGWGVAVVAAGDRSLRRPPRLPPPGRDRRWAGWAGRSSSGCGGWPGRMRCWRGPALDLGERDMRTSVQNTHHTRTRTHTVITSWG